MSAQNVLDVITGELLESFIRGAALTLTQVARLTSAMDVAAIFIGRPRYGELDRIYRITETWKFAG